MKQLITPWALLVALLSNCLLSHAQSQVMNNMNLEQLQKHVAQCNHNTVNAIARIASKEEMAVTGNFNITLTVNAVDTMYIDELIIGNNNFLTIYTGGSNNMSPPPVSGVFNSTYLLPGQSTTATINVTHATTNLPYYPTSFDLKVRTHKYNESESKISPVTVKVYFTPYNSVEIWDLRDFIKLPRVWAVDQGTAPARVSIPRTSIPVSTRPNPDQITEAWQKDFQVSRVPGLPYLIQMAAVHPDTIEIHKYNDSMEVVQGLHDGVLNKGLFGNTFKGTITGNLVANYINDLGTTVTIGLEGVKIAAYDEDIIYDEKLSQTHTGDNGYFDLSYSNWESWGEGGHIELYIQWWSENDNYDLDVIQNGFINSTFNISFSNHHWIGDVGTNYTNNMGNFFLNGEESKNPYKILNWATKAYKFTRGQIKASGAPDGLNIFAYDDDNITGGTSYCFPINWVIHPYISLTSGDMNHESTIWHEFGHFAMYYLQNSNYLYCSRDKHKLSEPSNTELSWTEGWATGYMNMLDAYYKYTDLESGREKYTETSASSRSNELRNPNVYGMSHLNGFRSEYFISSFVNDLYDGPTSFANINNVTVTDYNDVSGFWGYINGENDNLQLTPAIICKPLTDDAMPQSIVDYYNSLIKFINCKERVLLRKVAFQNGIKPDHTSNSSILSADNIGITHQTVTYTCPPLNNSRVDLFALQDVNTLNNLSLTYNFGSKPNNILVDPITITNSSLGVNANYPQGFFTSGIPNPTNNPIVNLEACNISTVDIGGKIVIGSMTTMANYYVKDGAKIVLNNAAQLEVFNGSKLIVEQGGILVFNKGASINLNGTNAIIVVQHGGKIQIGQDAVFNYNGDGFIRFETVYPVSTSIEAIGTNAQFKIIGGAFGSTAKKVMEITGGETLADLTTYNTPASSYNLTLFSIQNGHVVLSAGARIVVSGVGTKGDFRCLDVRAAVPNNPSTRHRGIVLNGQNGNMAYRVTVSDAITGIQSNNAYGGAGVDILQYNATRCSTGLYIWGVGARIQDAEISNCLTAIRLEGMTGSTRLYRTKLYANTNGVYAINCPNNVIELYQPNIYNNYYGLYGNNSRFAAVCGIIKDNASSVSINGIYQGANVYLTEYSNFIADPLMRVGAERVDLSNVRSVAFRQDIAAYGPYINQSQSSLLTSKDYSITGSLVRRNRILPPYPTLSAQNNLWGFSSGVSRSPLLSVDYNTNYQYNNATRVLNISDVSPIPTYLACGVGGPGGSGGDDRMRGLIGGEVTPIVNLTDKTMANGRMIKEVIQEGYSLFFDVAPNYATAVSNLTAALNTTFTTDELAEWSIAIPEINAQLIEALSEGIAEEQISVYSTDGVYTDLVQGVLELQDKLMVDFANTPLNLFVISMAKASLLRMLNNREACIQVLHNIGDDLYPDLNASKQSFLCMTTVEKLMLEGSIMPYQYENVYLCSSDEDYVSLPPPYSGQDDDGELSIQNNVAANKFSSCPLSVFPNPTNGLITVRFEGEETAKFQLEIVDIMGRSVVKHEGIFLLDNKLDFNLSKEPSGIYFIKMTSGNDVQLKKLVLAR